MNMRQIAWLLAASFYTISRALNYLRLGLLRNLESKTPVRRYEQKCWAI